MDELPKTKLRMLYQNSDVKRLIIDLKRCSTLPDLLTTSNSVYSPISGFKKSHTIIMVHFSARNLDHGACVDLLLRANQCQCWTKVVLRCYVLKYFREAWSTGCAFNYLSMIWKRIATQWKAPCLVGAYKNLSSRTLTPLASRSSLLAYGGAPQVLSK